MTSYKVEGYDWSGYIECEISEKCEREMEEMLDAMQEQGEVRAWAKDYRAAQHMFTLPPKNVLGSCGLSWSG